ncbi:MAG: hypothetical protein J5852_01695 [Clostridia bacterium]|nr:hypothetical protein [Clostridia bacterium]
MKTRFEKLLAVVISVCMIVSLIALPTVVATSVWDGSSASASLSGTGTAADPYLIKSADDLKYFADSVNGGTDYSGKVIYLLEDIDLDNQAFAPIGSTSAYFRGQFDGKNHTVSGINISSNLGTGTGFFGALHNGWIKNLHLEGSVICTLDAANYVGGLVGYTSGNITIYNCSFTGLVRSANTNQNRGYCGGLVGLSAACTTGTNIICSYSSGTVDTYGRSGGLVGGLENNASDILNIKDSYSDATVTGSSAGTSTFESGGTAGGILGFLQNGTVNMVNCFFAGQAPSKRSSGYAGPIVNHKAGGTLNLTRVYFDNEKNLLGSGASFAAAEDGTGQTTSNMTYAIWGNFPTTFITGNATVKHPILRISDMGTGTKDDPYVVDGTYDLRYFSYICGYGGLNVYNFRDDYIVLGSDLDMSTVANFTPIGSTNMYFRGNFDGKGHTVSDVTITMSNTAGVGFFGATGGNTIKNLKVTGNVRNNTSTGAVAGLVGKTTDTMYITNCSFDGTVYASNNLVSNGSGGYSTNEQNNLSAGGLVCDVGGNVNINRCSVSGTIDAFGRAGGLVASLNGSLTVTIKNSYCDANVTGKGPVDDSLSHLYTAGGLIGFLNTGTMTLTNCFFAGTFPAARANGMAGPIINHKAGGTFTCTNVYYLADAQAEVDGQEFGVYKNAAWFASAAAATTLGGNFDADTPHPILAEPNYTGSGTEADPYLLTSAADFQALNRFVLNDYNLEGLNFKLTTNLVLNDNHADYATWGDTAPANNWTSIGTQAKPFAGNLDGAGHSIYGMYCSYPDATTGTGFFGGTYRGTIKNFHIKDSYICAVRQLGGLTGYAQESNIENCSFEGYVKATNTTNNGGSAGSLIGNASAGNVVTRCYTGGTINAYSRSGGLIAAATAAGKNYIYDSYSTTDHAVPKPAEEGEANQFGSQHGGLVGVVQNGTMNIENCFYYGDCPHSGTVRGYIIGQNAGTATATNCYYVADDSYGTFGDAVTDPGELTDGTIVDLLNGTRAEAVWVQGEYYPILVLVGDIDRDGKITVGDALLALRHIENISLIGDLTRGDMDYDGDIDNDDYVAIKLEALGGIKIDAAPVVLSVWSNFG